MKATALPDMEGQMRVRAGEPTELRALPASGYDFQYPPLRILLICDDRYPAGVVRDHIKALKQYSRHQISLANPLNRRSPPPLFSSFDAIIIHYSVYAIGENYLAPYYQQAIRAFTGLKIQFIQDEYRNIDRMTERMRSFGIQALFSALRPPTATTVYCERSGLHGLFIFSTLPGYVPEELLGISCPPIRERSYHVTYRARELPYWLGKHSRQKDEIAHSFRSIATKYNLHVNISTREDERLYGREWIDLILSGKAVLGTEGGASIFDFDGKAETAVIEYLKSHRAACFDEVFEAVLRRFEGNIVHEAFTPRLLEAIALRTALVLFPGKYAGILEPGRHYIPLERDLSNAAEVAAALRDDALLQKMVDRTFGEIACAPEFSYRTHVARFDVAVDLVLDHHAGVAGASNARQFIHGAASGDTHVFARRLRDLRTFCAWLLHLARRLRPNDFRARRHYGS